MQTLSNQIPRIERVTIKNYRALRNVTIDKITPLTVLLGPNGSGKSTVFDVFAFLSECFTDGLRRALDRRGRLKELRSRGSEGPITIEIKYREKYRSPLITYTLEISDGPVITHERLEWRRQASGRPFTFLDYSNGRGKVITGESPEETDERREIDLTDSSVLAVNTLGQLAANPRVKALREFIIGWHLSYLSAQDTRGNPESGPQERLSKTGDNLANVLQHLHERHKEHLEMIFHKLQTRIPRLERFDARPLDDGRLLLLVKDAPFSDPILARYASDGTLKLLAYLIQLYDLNPPPLIGIEEPENFLHPKLLIGLAEECQIASSKTQLLVTTHSPFFVSGLRADQVRIVSRGEDGYTQITRASDIIGIDDFLSEGASLGDLWMEGHFKIGDPLR